MDISIPPYVRQIYDRLKDRGIKSYVVGGAVRDAYLGIMPGDYDMCASVPPLQLRAALSDFKIIPTGLKHGTVTVSQPEGNVEITSFRRETGYSDNRHPDAIEYTDRVEEDVQRRDFTINSLYYSPDEGVIDLVDGISDINRRLIRAVGAAERRFSEDALRIIRAMRFASVLDFEIEAETERAMLSLSGNLSEIAVERVYGELIKLLGGNCLPLIKYREIFLPFLGSYKKEKAALVSETENRAVKFALIFDSPETAREKCDFLKMPNKLSKRIRVLTENKDISFETDRDILFCLNSLGEEGARDLAEYKGLLNKKDMSQRLEEILSSDRVWQLRQLSVSGSDLKEAGFAGADIRNKLEELLALVMEARLENKRQVLMEYIKNDN